MKEIADVEITDTQEFLALVDNEVPILEEPSHSEAELRRELRTLRFTNPNDQIRMYQIFSDLKNLRSVEA